MWKVGVASSYLFLITEKDARFVHLFLDFFERIISFYFISSRKTFGGTKSLMRSGA